MFDLLSTHATVAIAGAVGSYHAARQKAEHERHLLALEAEEEVWFVENILPHLSGDERVRVLAERQRQKERREDIRRQERMHRERLAAEREKASAIRAQAEATRNNQSDGFLRGFIWGQLVD